MMDIFWIKQTAGSVIRDVVVCDCRVVVVVLLLVLLVLLVVVVLLWLYSAHRPPANYRHDLVSYVSLQRHTHLAQ